jgi:hypothetical protein
MVIKVDNFYYSKKENILVIVTSIDTVSIFKSDEIYYTVVGCHDAEINSWSVSRESFEQDFRRVAWLEN